MVFMLIIWQHHICLKEEQAACCAGMSKSGSSKLVVRGAGSTGYRVEAVSVEQLQDVWYPMEWGGSVEVCPTKLILHPLEDIARQCNLSSGH